MPTEILAAAVLAAAVVVRLALCLMFLLVAYLKGGKDDLEAAAKALHRIRDVGVAPAIRAALRQRANRDADSSEG